MATYPDLTKINLNQNIFGGYNNPIAANYGQKLNFIKQYYPQYGSTDARSIDMMYNKAVELTNTYGSNRGNKIGSKLAQTLRTAQSGNVQQPVQQPIQQTTQTTTGTSTGSGKSGGSSKVNSSNKNTVSVKDLFNDGTVTPTAVNNDSTNVVYTPTGQVDTSAFINYNYSPVRNIPNSQTLQQNNQTAPIQQTNAATNGNGNVEPSMFENYSVLKNGGGYIANSNNNPASALANLSFDANVANPNMTPAFATTNGSPMDYLQRMYQPVPKPFNSYGDAWNKGEGITGGISNMWNQFTTENGTLANPTASGLEKTLNSAGSLANLYGGIMNAKYQKDLIGLANRQQQFQEQQAANVNALQKQAQSNYDSSFVK